SGVNCRRFPFSRLIDSSWLPLHSVERVGVTFQLRRDISTKACSGDQRPRLLGVLLHTAAEFPGTVPTEYPSISRNTRGMRGTWLVSTCRWICSSFSLRRQITCIATQEARSIRTWLVHTRPTLN